MKKIDNLNHNRFLGKNYFLPQILENGDENSIGLSINPDTGELVKSISGETAAVSWGDITGTIEDQADLVQYISDNQGTAATWTTIEGKPAFVAEGANAAAARTALGLGTAATTASTAYATAAQGALASSSVQPATLDARLSAAQRSAINALVSPESDYADMTEATAAIKSIIDALKA